jgi:hypothetical protein
MSRALSPDPWDMDKRVGIVAIGLIATILLLFFFPCGMTLIVKSTDSRIYFQHDVRPGDVISLGFKHSVEKVIVVDTFTVTADSRLLLKNSTYGSMGAGLASDESYNITTDGQGNFTINDINQMFENVHFMTGSIPKHFIAVNGEKYPVYSVVPEERPLILEVERTTPVSMLYNSIRTRI